MCSVFCCRSFSGSDLHVPPPHRKCWLFDVGSSDCWFLVLESLFRRIRSDLVLLAGDFGAAGSVAVLFAVDRVSVPT
jgi:hypothetical protein